MVKLLVVMAITLAGFIVLSTAAISDSASATEHIATVEQESQTVYRSPYHFLDENARPIERLDWGPWEEVWNPRDVLVNDWIGTRNRGVGRLVLASRRSFCRFSSSEHEDYLVQFAERTVNAKWGADDDCYIVLSDFGATRARTPEVDSIAPRAEGDGYRESTDTFARRALAGDLHNSLRLLSVSAQQQPLLHLVTNVNTAIRETRVANMPDSVAAVVDIRPKFGPPLTLRPGQEITVRQGVPIGSPTPILGWGSRLSSRPTLRVSPLTLDLRSGQASQVLTIANAGGGMLYWSAQPNHGLLVVSPTSGILSDRGEQRVQVQLRRVGVLPGTDALEDSAANPSPGLRWLSLRPEEQQVAPTPITPSISVTSNGGQQTVSVQLPGTDLR